MKKYIALVLLAICCASCIYGGRDDDFNGSQPSGSSFEPITLSRTDFEATISVSDTTAVLNAGKIYVRENLLFINEKDQGFHVFDNSDPAQPINLFFVNVPLATDLAVRNNTIYVHHAVDLVTLSLNVPNKTVTETSRSQEVFPPLQSPDGYPASFFNVPSNEIIIGYRRKN